MAQNLLKLFQRFLMKQFYKMKVSLFSFIFLYGPLFLLFLRWCLFLAFSAINSLDFFFFSSRPPLFLLLGHLFFSFTNVRANLFSWVISPLLLFLWGRLIVFYGELLSFFINILLWFACSLLLLLFGAFFGSLLVVDCFHLFFLIFTIAMLTSSLTLLFLDFTLRSGITHTILIHCERVGFATFNLLWPSNVRERSFDTRGTDDSTLGATSGLFGIRTDTCSVC